MGFLSRGPTAEQEEQAGIALNALFADAGSIEAALAAKQKRGATAHVVEVAPQDMVGNLGKTSAFSAFREQFMATHPDVADMRAVTVQHFETFGYSRRAGIALYLKEPTLARQAGVWFLQCAN